MKDKLVFKAIYSLSAIIALPAVGMSNSSSVDNHMLNENTVVDLPFTITNDYSVEYNSSGGSFELIATDNASGGDISTIGSWMVESQQGIFSITGKNSLYWSEPLDVSDTSHKINVRFTITYSDDILYDVVVPISLNITPNTHKLPIIQNQYSSYYNPSFSGTVQLVSNINGGVWTIEPNEHFWVKGNNLNWDSTIQSGSHNLVVYYNCKNYAIVSKEITIEIFKPNLDGSNWIGKISGELRRQINNGVANYYYANNFIGVDLVIPAFVFNGSSVFQTKIDNYCFTQARLNDYLTICNGISSIGYYSFLECKSLTSINIPVTLKTINESAFQDCSNIVNIDLGERNEKLTIESDSFQNLPSVGNINCSGLWNSKDEILNEFAKGGLAKTWTVNGK